MSGTNSRNNTLWHRGRVWKSIRNDRGFLLIEALVAMAITAFAIVVIMQIAEHSISRQSLSIAVRNAHLEAESLLRSVTEHPKNAPSKIPLADGRTAVLTSSPFESDKGLITALNQPARLYKIQVAVFDQEGRVLATMQTLKSIDADQ